MLQVFRQFFLGLARNSRWMWILVYSCTIRTHLLTHTMISKRPNNAWWKPNEPKSTFRWFPNDVATTKFGHGRVVGMSIILGGTSLFYGYNLPHNQLWLWRSVEFRMNWWCHRLSQNTNQKLHRLAYLGAYGTHMFALGVWVGDGTSKTSFSCSITLKMLS